MKQLRKPVTDALARSSRFHPPASIYELADYASEVLSLCNSMGEGWLLTAEMVELIRSGCPNVVCTQPFACLPNHVVGKATIKELRRRYPESNIVAVDYDLSLIHISLRGRSGNRGVPAWSRAAPSGRPGARCRS